MAFPTINLDTALDTEAAAKEAVMVMAAYRDYAVALAERRHFTSRGIAVPRDLEMRLGDLAQRIPPSHRW